MTNSNQISEETIARAKRRVQRMQETDLLSWAEVAIPGMMRHLEQYQKTDDVAHLTELAFAEMQMNLVVTELMTKRAARDEELGA